jgi:ornithine cyclodeaminase/alanine dehydrogenase-like protein (mu-crystallin family)
MKIISERQIRDLGISPSTCLKWVKESFGMKKEAQLPPKLSIHPQGQDFFNTMPCLLPPSFGRFGVKEVHRIAGAVPALGSDILLYDSRNGDLLAMLDGDWITTMRTGAVATLAIQTFRKSGDVRYGFVGLGNTGRASMLCLLEAEPDTMHDVQLMRYKDQAELFIERFKDYGNVKFTIVADPEKMVRECDVIVSCITDAQDLFCKDDNAYRPGCLVIPVHSRGFQNCDLFFDKVFGDDTGHICGFKYFNRYKYFAEISQVLLGESQGRENDEERILSYNIGLGLHDILFASRIYDNIGAMSPDIEIKRETEKFWI